MFISLTPNCPLNHTGHLGRPALLPLFSRLAVITWSNRWVLISVFLAVVMSVSLISGSRSPLLVSIVYTAARVIVRSFTLSLITSFLLKILLWLSIFRKKACDPQPDTQSHLPVTSSLSIPSPLSVPSLSKLLPIPWAATLPTPNFCWRVLQLSEHCIPLSEHAATIGSLLSLVWAVGHMSAASGSLGVFSTQILFFSFKIH